MLGVSVCLCIAAPAFAESAPVYDADAMQQDQPFDAAPDQSHTCRHLRHLDKREEVHLFLYSRRFHLFLQGRLSMEQRMQRVEQQVNNMQTSDAASRVDSLQDQVQSLRGQIEQLTHQLEQVQNQQKTMYSDLDNRLALAGTKANHLLSPPSNPILGGLNDVVTAGSSE